MEELKRKQLLAIKDKQFLVVSSVDLQAHAPTGLDLYDSLLHLILRSNKSSFVHADKPRKAMAALREYSDLDSVDAIVAVGGDALVHEIVNGLLTRSDWILSIKVPISVLPLDSKSTSAHIYQAPDIALTSLLFLSHQQNQHTFKAPLQALTTLSGLRIFSVSRIECEMVHPVVNQTWFSLFSKASAPCPYNLAYLPYRKEIRRDASPNGSRNGSPVHAASAGFSGDIGYRSKTNPLRSPGAPEPQPVGPPLFYFSQICSEVLKPGSTVLPYSWKGLNVLASHKPENKAAGEKLGPLFTCVPIGAGVLSVDGNGVVEDNCSHKNENHEPGVLARTMCLYPPKGVGEEERMRVSGLVVDGVGFHETRGFSVEALDGVYVSLVRGSAIPDGSGSIKKRGRTGSYNGNSETTNSAAVAYSTKRIDTGRRCEGTQESSGGWSLMVVTGLIIIGVAFYARNAL
ncbi:hypothetical protein BDR26DRAFT_709907 [Obelidium mucronatum]|nr:hypothetical protein BDR26DRAFT_709907 [Obelidium mucronatum]